VVRVLVFLIILLPVFYFIGKWALRAWKEDDKEALEKAVDEKVDEAKQVDRLHRKAKRVDLDDLEKKKETIDKVTKL